MIIILTQLYSYTQPFTAGQRPWSWGDVRGRAGLDPLGFA